MKIFTSYSLPEMSTYNKNYNYNHKMPPTHGCSSPVAPPQQHKSFICIHWPTFVGLNKFASFTGTRWLGLKSPSFILLSHHTLILIWIFVFGPFIPDYVRAARQSQELLWQEVGVERLVCSNKSFKIPADSTQANEIQQRIRE